MTSTVDFASIDKRGAQVDYSVIPTNGWEENYEYQDDLGAAQDITNYVFTLTASNDTGGGADYTRGSDGKPVSVTYTGTTVSAVAGTFKFAIPASYFESIWGDEVIYSITVSISGETPRPVLWGVFSLEQIR